MADVLKSYSKWLRVALIINGIDPIDLHAGWNSVVFLLKTRKYFAAIRRIRDFIFQSCCVWIISSLPPVGSTKRRSGGGRVVREEK